MTKIIKETITTGRNSSNSIPGPTIATPVIADGDSSEPILTTQVKTGASNREMIEYMIYFFLGVIEVLLGFRLIFKLAGASLASSFVRVIYFITGLFVLPFEGIFRRAYAEGAEVTSVLEPSVLVAMVVYVILAWGFVKLVRISSGEKLES
ncbi:MAG: hypothetical protein WC841_05555 [Candidatus Shapirobacteria bacterium]|jgi:hypothetical protein